MNDAKRTYAFPLALTLLTLSVGILYILPPLIIQKHLRSIGQPFVFGFESHRNDLAYLTWAREIYDGHFPPSDPFSDTSRPVFQNPVPSLLLAGFLFASSGNISQAYLWAVFVFSQINFLLFYLLGQKLFRSRVWSVCFAVIGILTPIALRILNFDSTA